MGVGGVLAGAFDGDVAVSDHPVLPNEGTVERRCHGAEDKANDDPGP